MKIGVGRYANILSRLLNDSGENVSVDISPEIAPVFVLESDRPEWLFLGNERLMAATASVAASAGNQSTVRLRNPLGSNVLAVVESVTLFSNTGLADVRLAIGTAVVDLATPLANAIPRDTRWGSTGLSSGALKISSGNVVITGSALARGAAPVNTLMSFSNLPVVLFPGSHLEVGTSDLLVQLSVSFGYREREIGRYEKP